MPSPPWQSQRAVLLALALLCHFGTLPVPFTVFQKELFMANYAYLAADSLAARLPWRVMAVTEPLRAAVSLSQLPALCPLLSPGMPVAACVVRRAARAMARYVLLPLMLIWLLERRARHVFLEMQRRAAS